MSAPSVRVVVFLLLGFDFSCGSSLSIALLRVLCRLSKTLLSGSGDSRFQAARSGAAHVVAAKAPEHSAAHCDAISGKQHEKNRKKALVPKIQCFSRSRRSATRMCSASLATTSSGQASSARRSSRAGCGRGPFSRWNVGLSDLQLFSDCPLFFATLVIVSSANLIHALHGASLQFGRRVNEAAARRRLGKASPEDLKLLARTLDEVC